MQNGNTNVNNIYDIYETKFCNFLHVDGPKIGTYCGAEAPWWDGNRLRCDAHLDAYWPKETYQCVRILSRGARKGEACGSNTKFADSVCSRCRKTKRSIIRAVPVEQVTPIVDDHVRDIETSARRARSVAYFNETHKVVTEPTTSILPSGVEGRGYYVPFIDHSVPRPVVSVDGFPIHYPVEDGTDGRHPCECPMINMPRQSAILV